MKTAPVPADGPATVWPESVTLPAAALPADPGRGLSAVVAAGARSQRLELAGPVRFGVGPESDIAALGLLTEATARQVPVRWELAGEPPWPVRTLVHLLPPATGADPAARRYAESWRESYRYGLCTYRCGPGFTILRDQRPDGQRLRIRIRDPWTAVFARLVADASAPDDEPGRQLLGELTGAGLVLRLGPRHHVLPFRLRRWPIPCTAV